MADSRTAAEISRDIDEQRRRIENRVDELQQRLSPGQLVDEALSYTRNGGADFIANLGTTVSRNPIPSILLGVSVAWLMMRPQGMSPKVETIAPRNDREWDRELRRNGGTYQHADYHDYPLATVAGNTMQRLGQVVDDFGNRYSEFADDAGKTFKALSDEAGNRLGHFVDATGRSFRGFADSTGKRIEHFQDETGSMIDSAGGWAADTWHQAADAINAAQSGLGAGMQAMTQQAQRLSSDLSHRARDMSGSMGMEADQLMHGAVDMFRRQPLVGAAVAFAVGAALAAMIPRTRQEDEMIGETADSMKAEAMKTASALYEQGKAEVGAAVDKVSRSTGEVINKAKDELNSGLEQARDRLSGQQPDGSASA